MGWKRFEKEIRKAGKSVENESHRIVEKANDELTRFAERRVDVRTESGSAGTSAICQSAEVVPAPVPIHLHDADTVNEEIDANPDNLKPGRAYLINHLTFNDTKLTQRLGSEDDVNRLKKIFHKFGMEVIQINDGTLADVQATMEEIKSFDFENLSCLVIVIMSHGFEQNIIAAKDGRYSLDYNIMFPILRNKSLTSKLKLIITEGCKGIVDPMFQIEGVYLRPTTIPSEILQLHSCVEGYVSYLSKSGSIFITTLCDQLERFGLKKNILDIANAVVAAVKNKYFDIQIPMVHTNLTKKFVFGHYITYGNLGSVDVVQLIK